MPSKKTTTQKGKSAELIAAQYLKQLGYDILEMNFRAGRNEIDIIAAMEDLLVFVEVKARKDVRHGLPEEAINEEKMERLQMAASAYLEGQEKGKWPNIRFDALTVEKLDGKILLRHFKDIG